MGNRFEALERFQEALDIATDLYKSHPDYPGQVSNLNYQMKGVAEVSAAVGMHAEAKTTIERQAELLPNNTGQIRIAVNSLGTIAKQLKESPELDEENKQELLKDYAALAQSLMIQADGLGANTSCWLNDEPANHLVIEAP